ncbi:MAG TPA: hypothetical protein VFC78_09960 [Tepidisphaeraceae bacterium]|nr:hypothetical protein [Tepidisphaeraceae bacterium]
MTTQALTDDDLTTISKSVQVINSDPNFNPGQDNNYVSEDGTYALNISPALDGGAHDPVTYDVQWGDGTTDTTCQGSSDGMSVPTQYHQYLEEGWRLVTVTPSYGAVQNKYVGTADSTPTITAPPEQAVASGQSVTINASFTGGATSDQWATFIDLHDGTGPHAGTASGSASGSLSFNLSSPIAPGTYQPTITLYDKGGTAAAVSTFTLDVWGAVIDKGEANDVLMASSDGTQNLQPVWFYFPHPAGVALNLTIGTTDATDDYLWSSNSPVSGSTPTLGGSTTSFNLPEDATQSSVEYWVGAINGNTTANVLQFTLAGTVTSSPQLPPGTQPVPTTQAASNKLSDGGVQIISKNDPNADKIGPDVTGKTRDWLVGQLVDLTAVVTAPTVAGKKLKYHWDVPGYALRSFSTDPKTGGSVALADNNPGSAVGSSGTGITQSEIKFFWVYTAYDPASPGGAGPDPDTVGLKVSNSLATQPAPVTKFNLWSAIPVDPLISKNIVAGFYNRQMMVGPNLQNVPAEGLTGVNNGYGIEFSAAVGTPPGHGFAAGSFGFAQVVYSQNTFSVGGVVKGKAPTFQQWALDAGIPLGPEIGDKGKPVVPFNGPGGIGWATDSVHGICADSPGSVLTAGASTVVNNDFKTYLMYLPPGAGSSWVPLDWAGWKFWVQAYPKKVPDPGQVVPFRIATDEPKWTGFLPLNGVAWKAV